MLSPENLSETFAAIGSLVCHQIPERTLWIGGHHLPVCARDTGAYVGLLLGYAVLLSMRNKKGTGPPSLHPTLAMMLPLVIDSVGQAFGLWSSTNDLRLMTGLLFGAAVAPLLVYSLSLPPVDGAIPMVRKIQPEKALLDGKDHWLSARALGISTAVSFVLFLAIRSLDGSSFPLFYWLLSIPIIIMIGWHFFILIPLLVIGLLKSKKA